MTVGPTYSLESVFEFLRPMAAAAPPLLEQLSKPPAVPVIMTQLEEHRDIASSAASIDSEAMTSSHEVIT